MTARSASAHEPSAGPAAQPPAADGQRSAPLRATDAPRSAPLRATEARRITQDGADFDAVVVDLRRAHVRLYWQDDHHERFGDFPRLRAALQAQGRRLLAATNAGIFEPGYVPTGLLIERGQLLHPLNLAPGHGNFFLRPNGVFYIGPAGAGIVVSERFATVAAGTKEATQSGPVLLLDGAVPAALSPTSRNRRLRSGVCVISPWLIALAISRGEVTFHALARMFHRSLGCRSALYLDGTISGLYAPGLGRRDDAHGPYAAILGVTDK